MNFKKAPEAIKWALSRTGIIYLLIVMAAFFMVDMKAVAARIKLRRLNDARPEMSALVSFAKGEISPDKMNWKPYLNYFDMVIKYMPDEEVSKLFLGVAEYYSGGSYHRIRELIRHSADSYPFVFWNIYDAGVLAFEDGKMQDAVSYLEKSLLLPPERVEQAIKASVVYRQAMASSNFDIRVSAEVEAAREDVYLLLSAANYYTGNYEKAKGVAVYALGKMPLIDKEPFYFYAGAACLSLRQQQQAMGFFSKCVELKSRNPMVYRYVGEILKASGETGVAAAVLKAGETLQQNQPSGFPYPQRLRLRFI